MIVSAVIWALWSCWMEERGPCLQKNEACNSLHCVIVYVILNLFLLVYLLASPLSDSLLLSILSFLLHCLAPSELKGSYA